MNKEEISKVNALSESNVFALAQSEFPPMPEFIHKLSACGEQALSIIMGSRAKGFMDFLGAADLTHPELAKYFSSIDADSLMNVLNLCDLATKQGLKDIVPLLGKAVHKTTRDVFKGVDSRTQFVRALRAEWKEAARKAKQIRNIPLRLNFLGGKASGFNIYVRFNNTYKDEEAIARKKAERYRVLGCSTLQMEISKALKGFEAIFKDEIYGFHRISITNAFIILMRVHGLRKYNETVWLHDKKAVKSKSDNVVCTPRVYPLHALADIMPERIKKMVEHLESFPELGNKPVFDHFVVAVPGVDENIDTSPDKELIAERRIMPVLLGERDGKCYFISYWDSVNE